jgi:hypothetical protein
LVQPGDTREHPAIGFQVASVHSMSVFVAIALLPTIQQWQIALA